MATSAFFSAYPNFNHDPTAPLLAEFDRLSIHQSWSIAEKSSQRRDCLSQEFGHHYTDSDKLSGWQGLCEECGIAPVPRSITQCKKALKGINVSIVNLIDCRRRRGTARPKLFATKKALCQHIKDKHEVFPLRKAKEDGFLCALLKTVYPGRKGGRGGGELI